MFVWFRVFVVREDLTVSLSVDSRLVVSRVLLMACHLFCVLTPSIPFRTAPLPSPPSAFRISPLSDQGQHVDEPRIPPHARTCHAHAGSPVYAGARLARGLYLPCVCVETGNGIGRVNESTGPRRQMFLRQMCVCNLRSSCSLVIH